MIPLGLCQCGCGQQTRVARGRTEPGLFRSGFIAGILVGFLLAAPWMPGAWAAGHRHSGPRRQVPRAAYIGPALKSADPATWGDLGLLLEGRTLDVVLIFKEPPVTRVVLGFGPLPNHQAEPGAIALVLDCAADMRISVTPGGFAALQHVDSTPIQADPAEARVGGGPQFPSFTVDEDSDVPLDADAFTAAVSRRLGRVVLARVRISGAAESPTAAFIFEDPPGPAVVLRVRAGGGSAWLDLRGANPQGGGRR